MSGLAIEASKYRVNAIELNNVEWQLVRKDAGRLLWSTTMSRLGSTPSEGCKKLCGSVELSEIHSDGAKMKCMLNLSATASYSMSGMHRPMVMLLKVGLLQMLL